MLSVPSENLPDLLQVFGWFRVTRNIPLNSLAPRTGWLSVGGYIGSASVTYTYLELRLRKSLYQVWRETNTSIPRWHNAKKIRTHKTSATLQKFAAQFSLMLADPSHLMPDNIFPVHRQSGHITAGLLLVGCIEIKMKWRETQPLKSQLDTCDPTHFNASKHGQCLLLLGNLDDQWAWLAWQIFGGRLSAMTTLIQVSRCSLLPHHSYSSHKYSTPRAFGAAWAYVDALCIQCTETCNTHWLIARLEEHKNTHDRELLSV